MKFIITRNWDNGYTCDCCRQEGTEVIEREYGGNFEEYSSVEYKTVVDELKKNYPNSQIYRVAEQIS